jgi:hypothetical protein
MSSVWRLRIWQLPTIGRVLARAIRRALTSKAAANTGPTAGLDERSNAVSAREPALWRAIPADNSERDCPFWRKLEEEARAIAAGMTDPQPRRWMLLIAECYRFLADRAEIRICHKDVIRGSRQHIVGRRGDADVAFIRAEVQEDAPRVTIA